MNDSKMIRFNAIRLLELKNSSVNLVTGWRFTHHNSEINSRIVE